MTLHTRIFGLKLGLILCCIVIALCLAVQMLLESYIGVVMFFIGAAVTDFINWRNRDAA